MLRFLYSLFSEKEKGTVKLYIVLNFLSPIMDLFSFSMVLLVMNRVLTAGEASTKLIAFTFGMAAFSIVKSFFELLKTHISNKVVYDGARGVSLKLYDLIMSEDLKNHCEKEPMQALTAVKEDSTACIGIFVKIIGNIVSVITIIGYSAALIVYGKIVGIIILVPLLLFMLFLYYVNKNVIRNYGDKRRRLSIKTNAQVTTAFGAFKEMKIDNRSAYLLDRYGKTSEELARVQAQFSFRSGVSGVMLREGVMFFLFFFLGVLMLYRENLVTILASMIVYIGILIKMVPMLYGLIGNINSIEFAQKSYDELKKNMARYDEILQERNRTTECRTKKLSFKDGLYVEGLTFGYSPEKKIFENANIEIPAGKSIAIIGASGSGKTTFLDLILGLHKAEAGSVRYDDYELISQTDGEGHCNANLGDIVSYIPQVVYLNGETVKNNVAFFEEDDEIDEGKIVECLKTAQIWNDVSEMKDGINTEIGVNGAIISGGQRQRIALARALYKNFEILIMDEATAALDMETEKAVIDSIRQVKGDKTLLMVTHHMSLANECDIVYRIADKGFVRER